MPPSGSIRWKQPFCFLGFFFYDVGSKEKEKGNRAKYMQTQHTGLCQAFEMLTRLTFLIFFFDKTEYFCVSHLIMSSITKEALFCHMNAPSWLFQM